LHGLKVKKAQQADLSGEGTDDIRFSS